MKRTASQKIADALILLSILALLAEALLLPWIGAFSCFRSDLPGGVSFGSLMAVFAYDFDDGLGSLLRLTMESWTHPHSAALALFLWVVALCGAVILVQGIRILATVADGAPFSPRNALSLRWAGCACFVIAAGALGRTVFTLCWEGSPAALASYTALFVPLFIMAGLLCLVFSGLFHQAAKMKAENDLTV